MRKYEIASLFSGCGGGDLGLLGGFEFLNSWYERLRTKVVFANDVDVFAATTYMANFNHPFVCESISNIPSTEIPDHDILVGGFPCQAFSIVGQRRGISDERGNLFRDMARILREKQPAAFIAENVKGLININGGRVFDIVLDEFSAAGYELRHKVLNASNYGIPQKRERVFIVGFRSDLDVSFRFPTPENAIVPLGKVLIDDYLPKFVFSRRAVEGMKRANKAFNKGRAQNVHEPCNTVSSHLAKVSLNGTDPVLLVDEANEVYRRFTPLEAARIQSFPDNFSFPVSEFQAYKQIGNAIPPVLMWKLMREVISTLDTAETLDEPVRTNFVRSQREFPLFTFTESKT